MKNLARDLKAAGRRGYALASLKSCRQFFLTYPNLTTPGIGYAVRSQLVENGNSERICSAVRNKLTESPETTENIYAVRKQLADVMLLIPQVIEAARGSPDFFTTAFHGHTTALSCASPVNTLARFTRSRPRSQTGRHARRSGRSKAYSSSAWQKVATKKR